MTLFVNALLPNYHKPCMNTVSEYATQSQYPDTLDDQSLQCPSTVRQDNDKHYFYLNLWFDSGKDRSHDLESHTLYSRPAHEQARWPNRFKFWQNQTKKLQTSCLALRSLAFSITKILTAQYYDTVTGWEIRSWCWKPGFPVGQN